MKTVPEYSLDANIVLRYLLKDDEELFAKAQLLFDAIDQGELRAQLDPVNLAEIVWVMQSFYNVPPAEIAPVLEILLRSSNIDIANKEQYLTALHLYASGLHNFGDACACAAAMDCCDGRLLSFDQKLDRVPGIQRSEENNWQK